MSAMSTRVEGMVGGRAVALRALLRLILLGCLNLMTTLTGTISKLCGVSF